MSYSQQQLSLHDRYTTRDSPIEAKTHTDVESESYSELLKNELVGHIRMYITKVE